METLIAETHSKIDGLALSAPKAKATLDPGLQHP